MRKQIAARAVMNKKIRMLEADIDKNDENLDETSREYNRIKKVIGRRRKKDRNHRESFLRVNELKNSETRIKNTIHALKQIFPHIEVATHLVKLEIKELKKKNENLPSERPFDFTEHLEIQKGENEIDIGVYFSN